jgi:hypothetical protein
VVDALLPLDGATEAEVPVLEAARRQGVAGFQHAIRSELQALAQASLSEFQTQEEAQRTARAAQLVVETQADARGNVLRENVYRLVPDMAIFRDTEEEAESLLPIAQRVMAGYGVTTAAQLNALNESQFREVVAAVARRMRIEGAALAQFYVSRGMQPRVKQGDPSTALGAGRVVSVEPSGEPLQAGGGFKEPPGVVRTAGVAPGVTDPALAEYDRNEAPLWRERRTERRAVGTP